MPTISTQTQLQQLRPGDRVKYHGVRWSVADYSTYDDPHGYQTAEWLLRSPNGSEYYLLREVDPQNPETLVNWYLADEVRQPQIFLPNSGENIVSSLWQDIQEQKEPYPELQHFNTVYYFESKTRGSYKGDEGETPRITLDYWDKDHHRNLAFEAWSTGQLYVYSTKVVKPEEFSSFESGVGELESRQNLDVWFISRTIQLIVAASLVVVGLLMVIFG